MARPVTREVLEALWRNTAMRESAERQLAQDGAMICGLKGDIYVLYRDEWQEWKREMRTARGDVLE
jgi:hypothetical protein